MKPTIADIARIANVSKATVSRVINHKSQGVSPETTERILKIINEVGYLPNTLARSIVVDETKTLGLVIPDITNPFFPQMVRGIIHYANAQGYTVFLCDSGNDPLTEEKHVMSLIEKRVDGLILASSAAAESASLQALQHYGVPVVQVDRIVGSSSASVTIDNRKGMSEATRYFIEKGHRHIAYLGGPKGVSTATQRFDGYLDALSAAGLEQERDLIRAGEFTIASGAQMMEEVYSRHPEITAVIACCDLIAIGAVKALIHHGVQVPKLCEIIGFDGIELADVFDPSISTVRQPVDEMAEEAAKLLIGIVTGAITSNRHVVFEPSLFLRDTTR